MTRLPEIVVRLIHIKGPLKGRIQEFTEHRIGIGRHPANAVCFPSDLDIVSRNHADIVREGNRFKIIDHSTNGTYVGNKRVTEAYLRDGDVLSIADHRNPGSRDAHCQTAAFIAG
jgi:pSer/pThr/pTyr-binding forkhead associated (FHA) protein